MSFAFGVVVKLRGWDRTQLFDPEVTSLAQLLIMKPTALFAREDVFIKRIEDGEHTLLFKWDWDTEKWNPLEVSDGKADLHVDSSGGQSSSGKSPLQPTA